MQDSYSKHLNHSDIAFAGAISSAITRGICQPLDVLKIRFQLQVEPIHHGVESKYKSLTQALKLIVKEEGPGALWKGHVPAQLLSIVYGSTQFLCFEVLRKELLSMSVSKSALKPTSKSNVKTIFDSNFLVNFVSGSAAGGLATLFSFPFDVVRTRLVAQSETSRVYSGIFDAFRVIYKRERSVAFYRGLLPTVAQIAPHSGIQFMCYKLCDGFYRGVFSSVNGSESDKEGPTIVGSLVCGSFAGFCAKTAVYPFDLVKKRMQIQGLGGREVFGKRFVCSGFFSCVVETFRFEGFFGLYKGLAPSLIKAVVTSALHFCTYEFVCKMLIKTQVDS